MSTLNIIESTTRINHRPTLPKNVVNAPLSGGVSKKTPNLIHSSVP